MSISGVGGGAQMMRSFQPPSFSTLDSDASGGITLEELKSGAPGGASDTKSAARAEELFKAMDADESGTVSSDEKDAFDLKMQEQRQAMQFMTQLMAGGQKPPTNEEVFAATDADADGSVTLAEFSSSEAAESMSSEELEELFGVIDADSDGAITEVESSAFLDDLKTAVGGPGGPSGPPPGGPPPGGPPPSSSSSEEEEEESTALDLLTMAQNAYSSTSSAESDLLTTLSKIFDEAA